MPASKETNDLLEAIAKILLRCFVLGYCFLILWFAAYLLAGDLIYRLNGSLFGVSQHEINLMHFFGIALVKVSLFVFFLFPYVAIRLVLRSRAT